MALSLRCKDCGLQLKSVAEAQSHGEVSGHANFEESTEAVLNLVCTECGKPCRSQTEQDLHTKRTGHSHFSDKTSEVKPMDTEAEMKAASESLADGDPDTKPGANPKGDVELVAPNVDEGVLKQLEDMGFSRNKAVRALHFTDTSSMEAAVNWLMEHGEDADLDTPLLVPKVEEKPKLSPEEARKQAEELVRRAKEKREREERELERVREQERVRAGRELAAAKRTEADLQLKRNLEARRIEKAEEARARDKIRAKLEEDRRERRRRLGLPEELSEEEKAAERVAAAKKERAAVTRKLPVKPVLLAERLRAQLVDMKKAAGSNDAALKTCWATLLKYCGNVAQAPDEEKFRRIKLGGTAFRDRVGRVAGGEAVLETLGFERSPDGEALVLPRDKVNVAHLTVAGAELNNALINPFFGAL